MLDHAMVFLGADDEIDLRLGNEFRSPALRHAAHEAGHQRRAASTVAAHHAHLAQRLLLGLIAHAAGVDQHHVRVGFGARHGEAFFNEHLRHLLGVALVHLAAVGLDVNAGHEGGRIATPWRMTTPQGKRQGLFYSSLRERLSGIGGAAMLS